jgi:hypothetical protein
MREPTTTPTDAATRPDEPPVLDVESGNPPLPELPDLRDPHDWPEPAEHPTAPAEPGRDDD